MKWLVWKDIRDRWVRVGEVYADCKTVAVSRAVIFGRGCQVQSILSYEADPGLYEKLCLAAEQQAIIFDRRSEPRPQPYVDRRSTPPRAPSVMPLLTQGLSVQQ